MRKLIIILLLLSTQLIGYSQVQKVNQFNSWFTYSGNQKLNKKYSIHTLYSFRRNDFVKNWQQSLLRLGVNRKIKENLVATLGLDWVETFPYGKQPIAKQVTEYRTFEQFILKNSVGRIKLAHRYKLEQRFIESNASFKLRHRIRYRFIVAIPINHSKMIDKTFYITAFDELFINVGKNARFNYFNQNWVNIGIGYKFNNQTKIAVSYMNQYLPKSDNIRIENNNTLNIGFSHSFDFYKKYEK